MHEVLSNLHFQNKCCIAKLADTATSTGKECNALTSAGITLTHLCFTYDWTSKNFNFRSITITTVSAIFFLMAHNRNFKKLILLQKAVGPANLHFPYLKRALKPITTASVSHSEV